MPCGKSEIQNHEATANDQKYQPFSDIMTGYGLAKENSEFGITAHSASESFAENDSGVGFANSTNLENCTFKEKVQEAENRIATFFFVHNISFMISSELIDIFQDMDPLVLKTVRLALSKILRISNNVVCAAETNRITEILQKNHFQFMKMKQTIELRRKKLLLNIPRCGLCDKIITKFSQC